MGGIGSNCISGQYESAGEGIRRENQAYPQASVRFSDNIQTSSQSSIVAIN
jgi:hypothetical protein